MEVRNLVISFDKHNCRIGGQKGTLKTVNIVETLPNGKKKTVHSDIHFQSRETKQGYKNLLKLLKMPVKDAKRRAA